MDARRRPQPSRTQSEAQACSRQETRSEKDSGSANSRKGVLQINVSLATQRVTVFSNGVRVVQAPVSTGTASHPTPMGVFSIIEKDRFHRSNIYHNAPMFFMQRLTWSGVAMHEGVLPGVPASHGCIRLPREFAAAALADDKARRAGDRHRATKSRRSISRIPACSCRSQSRMPKSR